MINAAARASDTLGDLHSTEDLQHKAHLQQQVDEGRSALSELEEQVNGEDLDPGEDWPIFGALQTDAHRLIEEFARCEHELAKLIGTNDRSDIGAEDC